MNEELLKDKFLGCLVGLAVGDALGATNEFVAYKNVVKLTDIVGGGVHKLKIGEWTDDTSMALCLAESLIEKNQTLC
jgi:ADP-ribosyl-[dinitrogen reductase] hydrolase